jgi:DNA-directed RNA polymerase specialized sigma24 family protein
VLSRKEAEDQCLALREVVQRRDEIIQQAYLAGLSITVIARRMRIDRDTVRRAVDRTPEAPHRLVRFHSKG